MRCKACNKLLQDSEVSTVNKMVQDMDLCRVCISSSSNLDFDNPSMKVQRLQEATGFRDVWG